MDETVLAEIRRDPAVRKKIAMQSFVYFMAIYFPQYLQYKAAEMHKRMYEVAEDTTTNFFVIVAFRGSAKSTIFSLIYPLWAVLGKQRKKFVILASNTQKQSGLHFANLKRELEDNDLLKQDFGPFVADEGDWSNSKLIVAPTDARIMAVSLEQNIRGSRHRQYRPDLIIADDIEDLDSVKTQESRDKVEQWLTGNVIPMGSSDTKIIIVGNLLHADSLIMRLKDQIESNKRDGEYLSFPIIDDNDMPLWPSKFPNMEAVNLERRKIGNDASWYREYMLTIVSDEGQLVYGDWFHFYDTLPKNYDVMAYGVDLAISTKTHSDYTAIVSAYAVGRGKDLKIYILANPLNRRMEFPQTMDVLRTIAKERRGTIYIEEVAYQSAVFQQLKNEDYSVKPVRPNGQDKWARAALITPLIQNGTILFPKKGCELLIRQLTGFGVEAHDDLADAFVYLVTELYRQRKSMARIWARKPAGF